MTNQTASDWDHVAVDLCRIARNARAREHGDLPALSPALAKSAASLIDQLQSGGSVPADRVSYVVRGKIHFEWFGAQVHLVLAVTVGREAEVASYTKAGKYCLTRYSW